MNCCNDPSMMSSLSDTKAVQGKGLLFWRVNPLTFPNILPCSKYTPHYHRITPINGIYYNDLRRQIHKDIDNQNIVPDYKKRRIIKTSSPPTDKVSSYLQSRNVILSVHVIDQRYLTPQDVLGCFINNTNLNRLPSNLFSVFIHLPPSLHPSSIATPLKCTKYPIIVFT